MCLPLPQNCNVLLPLIKTKLIVNMAATVIIVMILIIVMVIITIVIIIIISYNFMPIYNTIA